MKDISFCHRLIFFCIKKGNSPKFTEIPTIAVCLTLLNDSDLLLSSVFVISETGVRKYVGALRRRSRLNTMLFQPSQNSMESSTSYMGFLIVQIYFHA